MAQSFIFNGNTSTPQELARKRALAAQIMGQGLAVAPRNTWDGLGNAFASIAGGITTNALNKEADRAEAAGTADAKEAFKSAIMTGSPVTTPTSTFGASPNPGVPSGGLASGPGALPPDAPTDRVSAAFDNQSVLPPTFNAAIDKHEGGGAYDTLFGHAQKGNGQFAGTQISRMSIGDAMAFADPGGNYAQSVKGKIGRVATPMGRYQIVGTTLRNSVKEMGLDPSTPFSAETQDRIAMHLAKKRVASADSMGGKIAALRSEWEGFKNVPAAQMAQIVNEVEGVSLGPSRAAPVAAGLTPDAIASYARTHGGGAQAATPAAAAIDRAAPPSGAVDPSAADPYEDVYAQARAYSSADERPAAAQPMPAQRAAAQPMPVQQVAPQPMPAQQPAMPALTQNNVDSDYPMMGAPANSQAAGQGFPAAPSMQQGGVDTQAILTALSHPFMNEGMRAGLMQLLEQKQAAQQAAAQAADPMRQAQLRKAQLEVAQMENPQAKQQALVNAGDGQLYDPNSGQWINAPDGGRTKKPPAVLEAEWRAEQAGLKPGTPEYQRFMLDGGNKGVTVNVGEEGGRNSEYEKQLGGSRAKRHIAIQEVGQEARRKSVQIQQLSDALDASPTGFEAIATQRLGDMGIKLENSSPLEAARALINQLIPAQRPPGSGTMSDADIAMFRSSLPSLINTPEGNRQIIQTMQQIMQYDAQMGEIADRVVGGELSPNDGDKAMRELANPLANLRKGGQPQSGAPQAGAPAQQAGAAKKVSSREEYQSLPSGAQFVAPDGSIRRKP